MERTDGGLAMNLDVFVEGEVLVFQSRHYFVQWRGWRLPIPAALTPSVCRVEHPDLGRGQFRFPLAMVHARWGRTLRQTGNFYDPFGVQCMTTVFAILTFQALPGAFDNLWHHEGSACLPQRSSARKEPA